ncbi:unnamed protein product [Toxocara canis]|uniref:Secreted protein n=1 Tax=Toxocara canis TaxID=6265 RepID=A0A183UDJ2_TOXCA|nr:unnamed protein product [Toxocara canis]
MSTLGMHTAALILKINFFGWAAPYLQPSGALAARARESCARCRPARKHGCALASSAARFVNKGTRAAPLLRPLLALYGAVGVYARAAERPTTCVRACA